MVYRYRPMRFVPTITTSEVIAIGSFSLAGTLWARGRSVNRQLGEKPVSQGLNRDIFLRRMPQVATFLRFVPDQVVSCDLFCCPMRRKQARYSRVTRPVWEKDGREKRDGTARSD